MTLTSKRIAEAMKRGYYIENGILYGPKGKISFNCSANQRYPTFSSNWDGRVFGIPVHTFAAHFYYGEEAVKQADCIRHLNGDVLDISVSNIVLGSHSDNQMDKDPEVRSAAAKKARAAQGTEAKNRKLTMDAVREIREAYKTLKGKTAPNGFAQTLCNKYGISRVTLCNIKNNKIYKERLNEC